MQLKKSKYLNVKNELELRKIKIKKRNKIMIGL